MTFQTSGSELERWPFPPGRAPFAVKGINYRGHLDWTKEHFPGGVPAMLALLEPKVAEFMAQPFLASSFYDLHPLALAGREMAPALGLRYLDFVRMRCQWQAEVDVKNVYRMLLRIVSAERVAQLMPKQIQQAFNFGVPSMRVVDKGHVTGATTGIPVPLLPWWSAVVETYVAHVLVLAGVDNAHVSLRRGADERSVGEVRMATIDVDVFFHAS